MKPNILKNRWLALFNNSDVSIVESLFENLVKNYGESHRYYHTLNHIALCLKEYDEVKEKVDDPFSVELALWFHDVIYAPKENDNEEKSSLYAAKVLSETGVEKELAGKICNLIEVTKHPSLPETLDEKYIVDIDLSILGAPSEIYECYSNQIRKEYSYVPEFFYSRGRKKVLNAFLMSENVYYTEYFRDKYELSAKKNIQNEIHRI